MNILIIHTRSLCYFSAEFFLDRIEEYLEKNEATVTRINLPQEDSDFGVLDSISPGKYDMVLDINSKLPYLKRDNGDFWLDYIDVPFYNYILDHPLYHHPGLSFPLSNYHALGIDKYHVKYMKSHYPHLKSVKYLPLAGTSPITHRPFDKRKNDLFFSGTFIPEETLKKERDFLTNKFGSSYKKLLIDLSELWNPYEETMEEALSYYLEKEKKSPEDFGFATSFSELMNCLYLLDRQKRNDTRLEILLRLVKEFPLTVMGEGWEVSPLKDTRATFISPSFYAPAMEVSARYKYILDINPAFRCGIHDRASNCFGASSLLISNMSSELSEGLKHKENMIFYKGTDIEEAVSQIQSLSLQEAKGIAKAGNDYYKENLTWDIFANELLKW